jgi:hypothetical protein
VLHMNVGRLRSFKTIEEKAKPRKTQDCGH